VKIPKGFIKNGKTEWFSDFSSQAFGHPFLLGRWD